MMRTLNVRLAAICLVVVVLLGGGVHLLHGFQVRRQANARKLASERAEDAFKELRTAVSETRDTLAAKNLSKQTEEQNKRQAIERLKEVLQVTGVSFEPKKDEINDLLFLAQKTEQEKLDAAIRILESYVGLIPNARKEQLHLGMLYAEKLDPRSIYVRNARAAYYKLEEVLRTADDRLDKEELRKARKTLVDMSLLVGRVADAESHVTKLLDETPNDPELLELAGQAFEVNRKYKEACDTYGKAIKIAPSQTNSYVRLAYVLRTGLQREKDADAVMRGMVDEKANAKSKEAIQKYAAYLLERGKFDDALVQAKRVLELAPEDRVGLLVAGTSYLKKGQFNTAEDFLNRGLKADKTNPAIYNAMAEIKIHAGRIDEAIAVFRQGLEVMREQQQLALTEQDLRRHALVGADIRYKLCNLLIGNGQIADAEKLMLGLGRSHDPKPDQILLPQLVGFLEAEIALQKREWKNAQSILKEILPKLNAIPGTQKTAYLQFGECCRQAGDVEGQIVALTGALKIDPNFVPARNALAEIFMSRGNLPEAAEQYSKISGSSPDAALSMARALVMLRLREGKKTTDWEPINKLLDEIEKKRSLTAGLAILRAEVIRAKDSPQAAADYLQAHLVEFPKIVEMRLAMVNLSMYQAERATDPDQRERLWKQASDYIDKAEHQMGDLAVLRVTRGNLAARRKDPQVVALLKRLGEHVDALNQAERVHLWINLGNLSRQANDLDLARLYYGLVAKEDPRNIVVRYLLCDLDLRDYEKNQMPNLQELDQRLNEIEPDAEKAAKGQRGPYWLFGKAVRTLARSTKPDPQSLVEARGYLQEAMAVRKDWSPLAVLAGKICEMQDEPDEALAFYSQAIHRMGERDDDVIRRTVHLLLPRGRVGEAGQLFEYLESEKSPLLSEMGQEYVNVKVYKGEIAEAEKDVAKVVAAGSQNYGDFFRQGQLYGVLVERLKLMAEIARREAAIAKTDEKLTDEVKRDKVEKAQQANSEVLRMAKRAEDAFMNARDLDPQASEVWIRLVQLLVELGQAEKARPLIAAAEASLKGDKAPITLAVCYELVNEADKAQAKYEEAAKAAPGTSRVLRQLAAFYLRHKKVERAEPLLHEIVKLDSPATLTDTCWARRNLALAAGSQGDFDHLREGMALIEENLHSKAASIDDYRAKVDFLVADPRKEKIGEAIQAMEDLVNRINATPDDYFKLAQLYLKKGDWPNYVTSMRGVLGAQKGAVKIEHRIFYIRSLMDKKQLDEADQWLQTVEQSVPNAFETVRLRAEYLFLRGNYRAAGDLLMGFLENPNAQPPNRGQQLLNVAVVLESFGDRLKSQGRQAEARECAERTNKVFDSLRRVSEAGDILFAAYLARQKRVRECLDVLELCGTKGHLENLASPAVSLIQSKAADSTQCQQLEKILVAAAKKADQPVPLLLVLAELHALQGQDDKRKYDASIADYREILRKAPRSIMAMNNLALSLARGSQDLDEETKRPRLAEALSLINQSLAISGPLAAVLDSRAIVYIFRGEYDKALEDSAAAVRDDGSAEEYFHQAWAYSLAGKKTEALASFAEAMKKGLDRKALDPRESSAYDRLKDGL